jgi:hypothetical protein
MNLSLDLSAPGSLDISERKDCEPPLEDRYDNTPLVDHYVKRIEVEVRYYDDDDSDEEDVEHWGHKRRFILRMNAFHVENEETQRAFHAHVEVALDRTQTAALRDSLAAFLTLDALA